LGTADFIFLKYFSEIQKLEEFQHFLFRSYWQR